MKSAYALTMAVLALIPAGMLMATPRVRLIKPPSGQWGIENLWKATVVSDTACDAWFEGFVFEATHGQVFWAKTKPFGLSRGTKVYRYKDVTVEKTDVAQGYEAFVTRSGHLPAGNYRFKLLLMPFGVGDSNTFDVKPVGPPRLISPPHGAKLAGLYPDFVWTPPTPRPPGAVIYELKLFEVMPGQTPEEARKSNPPWFEEKESRATSLKYPTSARELEARKGYAWQVTANPGGASEVRSFAIGESARMLARDQAIAMILKQVIKPESLSTGLIAFLGREPLVQGDSVCDADDSLNVRVMAGPTWFAWLDDDPRAGFAHKTRYVYVDAFTGRLTIEARSWWPLLNGRLVWYTREDWEIDRFIFFSNLGGR